MEVVRERRQHHSTVVLSRTEEGAKLVSPRVVSHVSPSTVRGMQNVGVTFSMNDIRNLTIRLSESSCKGFLSDDKRLKMSVKPL